jgi:hypothetical protein
MIITKVGICYKNGFYRRVMIVYALVVITITDKIIELAFSLTLIEQQLWQSGVSKKEMSLIFKHDARSLARPVTTWLSFKNLFTRQ